MNLDLKKIIDESKNSDEYKSNTRMYETNKYKLSINRPFIRDDEWKEYLKNVYPAWHESLYQDKWRINIIYYDNNENSKRKARRRSMLYSVYIHKHSTMKQIMEIFQRHLKRQRMAVTMCFGIDISPYILQHFSIRI